MEQMELATQNEDDVEMLEAYGISAEIESFNIYAAPAIFVWSTYTDGDATERYWSAEIDDYSARIARIDTDEYTVLEEIKRESSASLLRSLRDPANRSHFIEEILWIAASKCGLTEPAGYRECEQHLFWDEMRSEIGAAQ
jgi:hypothetical protein